MKNKKFVLDSYAVLALVADEPGSQVVADILLDDRAELFLSLISLGEIYYIVLRRQGEAAAAEVVQGVRNEAGLAIAEVPWERVKGAARLKAAGALSYADAFVLGLARELGAFVVTGDPELRAAGAKFGVKLVWLGS